MSDSSKQKHRNMLVGHFLFSGLASDEIDKILTNSLVRPVKKNSTLFVKGDEGDRLFAILKGRVKISVVSEEGREIVLAVMREGDFFGEIAFLDGCHRTADATVIEEAEIMSISRADFFPLVESHPEIYLKIIQILCDRLRITNETIEDSIFLTIPARVAKTLLKLGASYGQEQNGRIHFNIRISQQELANIIGTSREVVNRHIRQLQNDKVISVEERHIIINDIAALETLGHI